MSRLADDLHTADLIPPAAYYVAKLAADVGSAVDVAKLPIDTEEFISGFKGLRSAIDAARVVVFDDIARFAMPMMDSSASFSPKDCLPPLRDPGPMFLEARMPESEPGGYGGSVRAFGYMVRSLAEDEWREFARAVLRGTPEPGTACVHMTLLVEVVKGQISGPVANHYIPIDAATREVVADQWMSGYLPELPAQMRPPANVMNPILSRTLLPALLAWALMASPLAEFRRFEPAAALNKKRRQRGARPLRSYDELASRDAERILRYDGMGGLEGFGPALSRTRDVLVPPEPGVRRAYAAESRLWVPGMD